MKRKLTVTLILVLCITLLVSGLAGCAGKGNEGGGKDTLADSSTAKTDQTAKPDKEEGAKEVEDPLDKYAPIEGKVYEISWAKKQQGGTQVDKENANIVWHFEDMFNVKFDIHDYADETDISLRIASGERFDFVETRSPEQYTTFVEDGLLLELTDEMFERFAPEMWYSLNQEAPDFFDYGLVDGKRYSVGGLSYLDDYHYPIVWRKAWLEAIGLDTPPKTFDEFEAAMYAFAKDDPDGNGVDDTYGMSTTAMQMVFNYFNASGYAFGTTIWHEKDGELVWGAIEPGAKEAVRVLNKWYKDGVIDPEFITSENKGGYWALSHTFIEERIGLSCHGYFYHWTIPQKIEFNDEGNPLFLPEGSSNFNEIYNKKGEETLNEYTFGEPLVGEDGEQRARAVTNRYWGVFYGISSDLEETEPDKVGKILEIWSKINNTDFDTFMWSIYGEKDVDYTFNEYGAVQGLNPIGNVERGGNTLFHICPSPSLWKQSQKVRYDYADDPKNNFAVGTIKNAFIWTAPSLVKYKAELEKIQAESFIQMITGEKPIDYFDEYVDIWLSSGGNEYAKDVNDWYAQQPKN